VGKKAVTVLSVSVTEAGRAMARRLPWAAVHGDAATTVRARWGEVDGLVLFLATGAAVRIVAPLLSDKARDPAVVCVDQAGKFAIALCGGHTGGANELARAVAAQLGAQTVVTTATDAASITPLDLLPGFTATGDLAGVTTARLDGRIPTLERELPWPVPLDDGPGPERVIVTDRAVPEARGTAVLHPPSLVAGVGASSDAPPGAVATLLDAVLAEAGLARAAVGEVATIDRRAHDVALRAIGLPIRAFRADELAAVAVPSPSAVVARAIGSPSVAEAAALLAAGSGATLVVEKRKNDVATVAIARRATRRGQLHVVGLGPGDRSHRTPAASTAVSAAEVVIGYGPYIEQCADLLTPAHEVVASPIGDEVVRAKQALAEAGRGRRVALVCSGDAGIYGMASIVLELAAHDATDIDIDVVPGVPAGLAASALLGAPLGHDHAVISLSDLLTPWRAIEARLRAAAQSDLVVTLYNPRSRGRAWQLDAARVILLEHRLPTTPVGVVTDAGRARERISLTTLEDLDPSAVGMTTCVVVGSSSTRVLGGRMVTPRGYEP
jgi:cobalt-precorrin 5A hydrolase/precorrin-3B C17-methyltransferase